MKKTILGIILFSALFIFSGCGNSQPEIAGDDSSIILFYGEECPHCKIVEQYIADNNIKDMLVFSELEVNHNTANASLMVEKQKACKLNKKNIGAVPFLWTAEKCYLGQDEIIQFFLFKTQIDIE